jgi:hypothetical protein
LIHRLLASAIPILLLVSCTTGPRLEVWPVDSLEKVFPDDVAGTHALGRQPWLVARNGHVNIQIALRCKREVKGLRVEVHEPERGGVRLPVKVRHAGYVAVGSNPAGMPPEELARMAPARFPDPLLEDFPFDLAAGETQAVWLTVACPGGTRTGDYRGEALLVANGRRIGTQAFTVRVTGAEVPRERTLAVTNWLNLNEPYLQRFYPAIEKHPEEYWQVLGNIGRVMADYRQNMLLTPVNSLTDATVQGGAIHYRFDRLDRWVETFEKAGLLGTIEGGHLLGRASGYQTELVVPSRVVESGGVVWKSLAPDDPRAAAYLRGFLVALYAHLREKGWTGRYIQHIHDEPHGGELAAYQKYSRLIRSALPGIPTIDAIDINENLQVLDESTDIWVMILGRFDHRMDAVEAHRRRGGQVWFYTCTAPQGRYLNRFIDQPLLKTRLLHWLNARYDLAGYLHWGGNYWGPRPFENVQLVINDNNTLLPAGDNALVYPAPGAGSVWGSVRLEAMREGIEDYELLRVLSQKNPRAARALAEAAIPHMNDYVRDVKVFRELQCRLLEGN